MLGSENVYFQPPSNVKMLYPAIEYHLDDIDTQHADNQSFRSNRRYQVTVIDTDVDSVLVAKVVALPLSSFERYFAADDLHHFVFNLYF